MFLGTRSEWVAGHRSTLCWLKRNSFENNFRSFRKWSILLGLKFSEPFIGWASNRCKAWSNGRQWMQTSQEGGSGLIERLQWLRGAWANQLNLGTVALSRFCLNSLIELGKWVCPDRTEASWLFCLIKKWRQSFFTWTTRNPQVCGY